MNLRVAGYVALGLAAVALIAARIQGLESPTEDHGPPFALVDARTGQPFTQDTLYGQPTAMFFGFTSCPEICPTTLARITTYVKKLGRDADKIRFAFVTVDPERDTAERMKAYVEAFSPRIVGLTGTRAEIDRTIARFGVFAKKIPSGDDYTYDHTAVLLLVDRAGMTTGTADPHDAPEDEVMTKLRGLIAN